MELGKPYVPVSDPPRPDADVSTPALIRIVAVELRYNGWVKGKNNSIKIPKSEARAAELLAASPELAEVATAYARRTVTTREIYVAVKAVL